MLFGGSIMLGEDPCPHFWMLTGGLDFCQEWAQRQSCLWHRRTGEEQRRFDVEWWGNIIQEMTFELCLHAPETWEWECDLSCVQGNGREKAQGDSFQPNFEGMLSLDTIVNHYLFNKHQLPDPWMGPGTSSASPEASTLWGGTFLSKRHPS